MVTPGQPTNQPVRERLLRAYNQRNDLAFDRCLAALDAFAATERAACAKLADQIAAALEDLAKEIRERGRS